MALLDHWAAAMMCLHEYPDLEQRSDEWFALRRGILTASVVGRLLTVSHLGAVDYDCPGCGAPAGDPCRSKVRRNGEEGAPVKTPHPERAAVAVAFEDTSPLVVKPSTGEDARTLTITLFAERITGRTEENFVNDDMFRGIQCEPIARDIYSKHHAPAAEVGFMRRDEDGWTLGYSPDGVVGDDGLVEIKAPRAKTHLRTILDDEVPVRHMPQCQAGLLVTGRQWIDYVSFFGGLPLYVKRVLPDRGWFEAIESAARQFEDAVTEMGSRYEDSARGLPQTERVDLELVI